ncbi:ABC transporter permease [Bailinhaonella thermotolerans]|uniref:ABC transporter permease n=1 Tax=Bailinhaonella thermotolerans TaxID=1070861 RepID=A0A3A4ADJ2_9ACTN|nr:ABC transporter permease [Bailinhaonella thermotolerans]RJL23673.1 ABC transporter permease [Bailinhaonella thermotolerans]
MATGIKVGAELEAPRKAIFRLTWKTLLLAIAALVVLLSVIRVITGANDITSGGTMNAAIGLAVPIAMAGLGGLWAERAGVVNIGLEGMMMLGTWFGAWAGVQFANPWAGVVAGLVGGAVGGLLHALATVTFGVDHIISGVAINILGLGVTQYLSKQIFTGMQGGGETQSPPIPGITKVSLPGIDGPLSSLEKQHIFLLSDLAGILRGLFVDVSLLTIVAILLIPLSFFVLWRTAFGLRLRSCGERPVAAESLGVNVYKYKYIAVVVSGAMAGLGGAFLSIVASGIYREGQTAGRGFIGLAAMIFGNWRPGGLAAGAALFGYTDALQLRGGGLSVHALLLVVVVLLVAVTVWQATRARVRPAAIAGVMAALVLVYYLVTDTIPQEFTQFTPHLVTLLVLSLAAQRLRMPAADGVIYRKGQTG